MINNFKEIHIGSLILDRLKECEITNDRICKFLNCTEDEMKKMFISPTIDSYTLLRWSKLLKYDFFRIYTTHLILYSPAQKDNKQNQNISTMPKFRKHVYTQQIIDFILEEVGKKNMTRQEVLDYYGIPKTTLYKWIKKYGQEK